jgi:hypothetical protein
MTNELPQERTIYEIRRKKPTIYEIKRNVSSTGSYFFSRGAMKAFNQTLKSFHVERWDDGRFRISAPSYSRYTGLLMGITIRFYNPLTHELTHD